MDDKMLFFNSEVLINKQSILEHFKRDNKKMLMDKNVEIGCKKGKVNSENQDSFFYLIDGDVKIIGVFDGHGVKGHLASSVAMGAMAKYIQNSQRFKDIRRVDLDDQFVEKTIRKCFRYAQD
jgi:serine/threonine protein phosphatase PrpC